MGLIESLTEPKQINYAYVIYVAVFFFFGKFVRFEITNQPVVKCNELMLVLRSANYHCFSSIISYISHFCFCKGNYH